MDLKTVFVTNRNLNKGKTAKKKLFGDKLAKYGNFYFASAERKDKEVIKMLHDIPHKTIKKTYELSLVEQNNVSDYLNEVIASCDNGRPWVFFLHGNNQTLSKNLVKSRIIQDEYNVNMIIFSWPSKSYDPKMLPKLVIGTLLSANLPTKQIGKWIQKKAFKDKVKQYKRARLFAEKTAPTFNIALHRIMEDLLIPLRNEYDTHSCLLVHSLGHYVLRKAATEGSPLFDDTYKFNKCMLHQADEENANHAEWISSLKIVDNSDTSITRNKKDIVLLMSGVVNNDLNVLKACTRLGNRWDRDSEEGSPLNYIDFTGLDDVGLGHGVAWDDDRSSEVDDLCRPILTGE